MGVAVDATGANAAEARERAFTQGRTLALRQLLDEVATDPASVDVDALSPAELDGLVQSFQVEEELASAGRYTATLTYVFSPEAVRALLGQRGAAVSATFSRPVLVLPVLADASATRLWDSPNPWLDAWLDASPAGRLVPAAVPFGDLQDVTEVSVEDAMTGNRARLDVMAQRYQAGDSVVAVATPGPTGVSVSVNRYGMEPGVPFTVEVPAGPDEAATFAAAVDAVADRLDQDWRERTRILSGTRTTLAVLVPIMAASDWFETRSRIARVLPIVSTTLVSLSPREAVLEIQYVGTEDQLRLALGQQDLTLAQGLAAPEIRRGGAFGMPPVQP
jgi:hypothetical protein